MRRLIALALAGLTTACVSGFKSNETEPQRYVLEASGRAAAAQTVAAAPGVSSGPAAPAAATAAVVLMPEMAAGLDTDRIALLQPGQKLNYYAKARWADSLPMLLQAAAVDGLRASGRFSDVEPEGSPFRGDILLRIEVHDFEVDYAAGAPIAHVALRVTLGRRVDRGIIAVANADSRVPAAADRMQSVVDALQAAFTDALSQLTTALANSETH
jgi:cholesterol transport system auxiliary component